MARVSGINAPSIRKEELKNPVLLVVDMVNGFVKEGALADPAIESAIPPIQHLLESGIPAWFICDSHTEDSAEFENFPVHCLKGSPEAEIVEELKPYASKVLEKNSISAAFAPDFPKMLAELESAGDIIITGCCTDLCVLQLALPLKSWLSQNNLKDRRIIVPVDAVETYEIPQVHEAQFWNKTALNNMAVNGIEIVSDIK